LARDDPAPNATRHGFFANAARLRGSGYPISRVPKRQSSLGLEQDHGGEVVQDGTVGSKTRRWTKPPVDRVDDAMLGSGWSGRQAPDLRLVSFGVRGPVGGDAGVSPAEHPEVGTGRGAAVHLLPAAWHTHSGCGSFFISAQLASRPSRLLCLASEARATRCRGKRSFDQKQNGCWRSPGFSARSQCGVRRSG